MDDVKVPKLSKWPFFLGDLALMGFATLLIYLSPQPLAAGVIGTAGAAVLAGAWLAVTPFLMEYRAAVKLTETAGLLSTLDQIKNLETVNQQIREATGSWQVAHELAQETVQTAKGISERMAAEAKAFADFLQKANDTEKAHLRLEVEKQRRAEGEWLQITTAMLDHAYALYQAAVRSGQPGLVEQLGRFQGACRDVARRVGLVPFMPGNNEAFDPRAHQLAEANAQPPDDARIGETLATGYTYQGQLLRRALVSLQLVEDSNGGQGPATSRWPSEESGAGDRVPDAEALGAGSPTAPAEEKANEGPAATPDSTTKPVQPAIPTPPSEQQLF